MKKLEIITQVGRDNKRLLAESGISIINEF